MPQRQIVIEVQRYSPARGHGQYTRVYTVPAWDGMMVLDALVYIRDELDPTLAFRWSCRMGVCGSCGMTVNDAPRLTCQDPVSRYRGKLIRVAPLDNFPVVRDLVVDISDFMEKLQAVKPWIIRKEEKPLAEGEYLQTPQELGAYADHSACINCMLCYAACPIYGTQPEFIGPAAIALAYRYSLDSRDQGSRERGATLSRPEAVWECAFVGECSVACPKHVMPAEAIQRSKVRNLARWAASILLPRGVT